SFGVGGTNAHLILEQSPEPVTGSGSREYKLIVISARSSTALESASRNLAEHLRDNRDQELADMAYTLQVGRKRMRRRRAVVCRDGQEALRLLESKESQEIFSIDREIENPRLVFMFPGQGSQYVNMGRQLYECEKEFGRQVAGCSEVLRKHLGSDLRRVLY